LARATSNLRSGNSPFQSLEGAFQLKSGIISTISNLNIVTTHYNAEIQGKSPWNGRGLDYKGVAHLKAEKIDLPFMLKGNYNEPSLRFDVQQLIKQSRATLPLRSGARDEEAAKVVREIISRSPAPATPSEDPIRKILNLPQKP
jgi:AsmA protein